MKAGDVEVPDDETSYFTYVPPELVPFSPVSRVNCGDSSKSHAVIITC
jgi:hypothetical protein